MFYNTQIRKGLKMANYTCTYRTNYFQVTDETMYQKIMSRVSAEDLRDLSEDDKHCFGGYGGFSYDNNAVSVYDVPEICQKYAGKEDCFVSCTTENGLRKWQMYTREGNVVVPSEDLLYTEEGVLLAWDELSDYFKLYTKDGTLFWEKQDIDDCEFDNFLSDIQAILPDGECFVYIESGNEKLRVVDGCAIVVTKDDIQSVGLCTFVSDKVKEMLGQEAETQYTY